MVMAAGKNSLAEEKIKGNIDMTFIGENALSMLLVGEAEPKSQRNRAVHELEYLQNKWVEGGGGLNVVGK